jgi:MoaA/NifB/PqqE/SkfB family radical SAM enzyme
MADDKVVAVSSLESPDHATRKDPKIISAIWFIGKRCNYDCSYCSPFIHDNYSLHIPYKDACVFVDHLSEYSLNLDKKIKFSISGGEPFIHPDFLKILEHINNKPNVTMLSVATNGSLPLDVYIKSAKYITNLTVSVHLEQNESVIKKTIEKIIELNKITTWFLNVNLMAVSGKLNLIKKIEKNLKENKVKYVLRKIDPPGNQPYKKITKKEYVDQGKKINIEQYFQDKINHKNYINENLNEYWKSYYNNEELKYLNQSNKDTWNNIRLHTENGYIETNTDELKSQGKNRWKNWYCFIGIDSLNIQFDGTIYRGYCMAGAPIGKIGEKINWPDQPIVCPIKYCECNADMVIRKAKNKKYMSKIDE